jgi:hypothetical protein
MFVEDLILRLARDAQYAGSPPIIRTYSANIKIISDFSSLILQKKGLTEKQRDLAIKIISKYQKELTTEFSYDVKSFLINPVFRDPVRTIILTKKITVDPDVHCRILAKFPYNNNLINQIKTYKANASDGGFNIYWDGSKSSWSFNAIASNFLWLRTWGEENNFSFDESFEELFKNYTEMANNLENYLPIICYKNERFFYKNTIESIPQPESTDVIEVLMHARRYGIHLWDENISALLESYDEPVRTFFYKTDCQMMIPKDENPITLNQISNLIRASKNVLFIVPGGHEYENLKTTQEFLNNLGYDNSTMSVLFRIEKESDKTNFNEYIKNNCLNNGLNDCVKFCFISVKLPKPVIESSKNFDLVIKLSEEINITHAGLRNFLACHHNVILVNSVPRKVAYKVAYLVW